MSRKAMHALLLLALGGPAYAQVEQTQSAESATAARPSMEGVMSAFLGSRLPELHTRVLITWDESGQVSEATVEPSTRNPKLDRAIRAWAKQVRLNPGKAGTGWLPIDIGPSG